VQSQAGFALADESVPEILFRTAGGDEPDNRHAWRQAHAVEVSFRHFAIRGKAAR
jgi:hypothetical protein